MRFPIAAVSQAVAKDRSDAGGLRKPSQPNQKQIVLSELMPTQNQHASTRASLPGSAPLDGLV